MKIRCLNCMREYDDGESCCPYCGFVPGTPPNELYHLHPGVELAGRYVIGTVIAYGGFGIIYRTWDKKLEVMVAVKEYFPANYVNRNPGEKEIFVYTSKKQGEFQQGLESFLEEARNTSKFSSYPNIVNVYDYFRENGTAYMVMEYMDGVSLKEYTKRMGGKIPWKQAVAVLASICDVLKVVHEAGILHRDISPDNIMICRDGTVKLFDFGAARFLDTEKEADRTIILKIGFAPPEQYRKRSKQGPWTDIYALGATLYREVTGVVPEESENRQTSVLRKEPDPLVSPEKLNPELPTYLVRAIVKAMAIRPELRFKNVMQFKAAILNKKPAQDLEKELKKRKRLRRAGIAAVLAVVVLGAAGSIGYYRSMEQQATLKGVQLQIWLPLAEGETQEDVSSLFEQATQEFSQDYPGVELEVSCIPQEEYETQLANAADSGENFPTLYETGNLSGDFTPQMADLSDLFELIDAQDYYFFDQIQAGEGGVFQIPLGMDLSVLYGNTSLMEGGRTPDGENSEEKFLAGESLFWMSDTGSYSQVQQQIPGNYSILEMPETIGRFKQVWSVSSQADSEQHTAAVRLLYYLLGDNAQDVLYIQNDTDLPINKNEFSVYMDINQEMSFLQDILEQPMEMDFSTEQEYQDQLDQMYQSAAEDPDSVLTTDGSEKE